MENLRPLFGRANKILNELEVLEKGKVEGKIFEKTKMGLVSRLSELNNRIISVSSVSEAKGAAAVERIVSRPPQQLLMRTSKATEIADKKTLKAIRKIIRRKRKVKKAKPTGEIEIRQPNFYVRFANLFFRNISNKLLQKHRLKEISLNIRKSGLNILIHSYVSLIFLNTLVAFFLGILLGIFFSLFSIKLVLSPFPFNIEFLSFNFIKFVKNIIAWPLILSAGTFVLSYYYPNFEVNSRRNKIHDDLPFAIIHMSAIAGSGVGPTKIFKLISETKEYREFSKETRKVVNKINLYGYDLTTALKESARLSPSNKVKDLFNGMATTIATGGDLKLYLEKKSSDSMLEYKLNRRKFAEAAGTYADVYTGLLIAAPLIFGVMLAVMAPLGGTLFGLSFQTLSIIGLVAIFLLNVAFIIFMKIVQPSE